MKFISHKIVFKPLGKTHNLVKKDSPNNEGMFIHSYVVFDNKSQAKKYEKQGYLALSQTAIELRAALNNNSEFKKFLARQKCNALGKVIDIKKVLPTWHYLSPEEIIKSVTQSPITLEAKREYNIKDILLPQILMLVKYRCIFLPALDTDIKIIPEYQERGRFSYENRKEIRPVSINLNISTAMKISKIRNYLYANRKYIESQLKLLKSESFKISEKERKVLAAGKEKARKIGENLGLQEDNVRRKRSDAKKKIKSLFWPKSQNNIDDKIKL